jgi:alpha-L-rhamnosidase
MQKHRLIRLILLVFLLFLCEWPLFSKISKPFVLRVENTSGTRVLNTAQPRFRWSIQEFGRNTKQAYYQIQVSSSQALLRANTPDFWDSGKKYATQSPDVPYCGKSLLSATTFYWRVRVWSNGKPTPWSAVESFRTGLSDSEASTPDSRLQPSVKPLEVAPKVPYQIGQWQANWIGLDSLFSWDRHEEHSRLSARYFRKEFQLPSVPTQANVYVTGLGMFELYVNGRKIGDQVLFPSPTDYTQEVKYTCFDLKPYLKPGANVVGMVLGNGRFYNMRQNVKPWKIRTFGFPKLLFQLEATFRDGSRQLLLSDASWKVTADGPIRSNNEFDGEIYDATKEMPGWATAGFDDSKWLNARLVNDPTVNRRFFANDKPQSNEPKTPHGNLNLKQARRVGQLNEPMKVMQTLKPVRIYQYKPDTFVVDFGQNFAGWVQFKVQGPRGKRVQLHYAENVEKDGRIYVDNLRSASTTDIYILKGEGIESYEPTFVYHGFRYVEVAGWPGTPTLENFSGRLVYDTMATTGTFQSSDSTLNGIFRNAWWGIASNYKGMPVDCPQRDERQPWLGDRSNGCWGESYLFDNHLLYAKWVDDMQESMSQEGQIPDIAPNYYNYYTDNMTWPGTYLLVSYMLYRQYGDTAVIQKHYPYMKKWMRYMTSKYLTSDGILNRDKYGDWCMPPESPELIHSADTSRITEGALIGTAYYYRMLRILEEFANVLQLADESKGFANQAERTAEAFQKRFFNAERHCYANNTATANILPLAMGITPEKEAEAVFRNIEDIVVHRNDSHICTGVIGTAWFMRTLSRFGRGDLAYKIASTRSYPSWGYMLDKGATTIWELWNGDTANPWMNSQNHVMLLGDLLIWYYEHLAGIRNADGSNAFSQIELKPDFPTGLDYVNATYRSVRGPITSNWRKSGNNLLWDITIPFNSEAFVYIPATAQNAVYESGKPASKAAGVTFLRMESGRAVYRIGSGAYHFTTKNEHR